MRQEQRKTKKRGTIPLVLKGFLAKSKIKKGACISTHSLYSENRHSIPKSPAPARAKRGRGRGGARDAGVSVPKITKKCGCQVAGKWNFIFYFFKGFFLLGKNCNKKKLAP